MGNYSAGGGCAGKVTTVSRLDERLLEALAPLAPKPPDTAKAATKKRYSELVSARTAVVFAEELRDRGLQGTRPGGPGETGTSGAERRMSGGIGAKKVDVTWATEASGLLLAISIKSINFRDLKAGNYQSLLAGAPDTPVPFSDAFDDLVRLVARRDPDFYRAVDGSLKPS